MSNQEYDIDLEIRNEFIDEALEDLTSIASLFVELESGHAGKDAVDRIFRVAHTIKGNSAYFDLMKIKALAHEIENVLADVRKDVLVPTPDMVSVLLAGTDELTAMLTRVRGGGAEMQDAPAFEKLLAGLATVREKNTADQASLWEELIDTLESGLLEGEETAGEKLESALALAVRIGQTTTAGKEATCGFGLNPASSLDTMAGKPEPDIPDASAHPADQPSPEAEPEPDPGNAPSGGKQAQAAAKTMRVTEGSIDSFLAYVGDLVVLREMYDHLQVKLAGTGGREAMELRRINEAFTELSHNLQKSIMDIRKVPLGNLLKRAPRIIRDVATARGKRIETRLEGNDIMVDKSLVETLEGPLVHMIRNAADHGVETPELRTAAGKDTTGVITIAATETADTLRLTVQDDGRGLDREALTRKGVEMGLVAEGARLTDEDLVKLLFSAGVSTAEQVSDISGRGVGMDVVRQNIESGGGSITVRSEPGQGSTFTIEVKKSVNTQIIDGFGIIDQGNPFIFPMERVVRCFRPGESTVQSAMGKGTFVRDGDELIAIHNFTLLCGGELDQVADPAQSILLVLEGSGRKIALQIDDIDSVKQVVLKDVEGLNADHDLFIGGAVMGNGQVAMIVDVDQLVGEALSCETSICQAADQLEPETVPC